MIRFCLLYIFGGIYIDLKLVLNPINVSFFKKFDYHFAKNRRLGGKSWKIVENSFLFFKKPGNPLLKKVIERIVDNVKRRDKTSHKLYISGPMLLGEYLKDLQPTLKFKGQKKPKRKFIYSYNGYNIIDNELENYYQNKNNQKYWTLWDQNKVFKQ